MKCWEDFIGKYDDEVVHIGALEKIIRPLNPIIFTYGLCKTYEKCSKAIV